MSATIGGCVLLISESAIAQCVPVVYAFRHAEDLDPVTDHLPEYTDNTPPSNGGNPALSALSMRYIQKNQMETMVQQIHITQRAPWPTP